jgi:hypothetical protein
MVVLRFRSGEVRRSSCDLTVMRRLWGPAVARRISCRLQQLEAMTTLADLSFLPFDSYEHDGGTIEVAVADHLALFIEPGADSSEREALVHTIIVTGLGDRSTVARTS